MIFMILAFIFISCCLWVTMCEYPHQARIPLIILTACCICAQFVGK